MHTNDRVGYAPRFLREMGVHPLDVICRRRGQVVELQGHYVNVAWDDGQSEYIPAGDVERQPEMEAVES